MDGTTAIKIDYYEELKAKADKYDNAKLLIDFTDSIIVNSIEKKYIALPVVGYQAFLDIQLKAKFYDEREKPYKADPLTNDERGRKNAVCKCSGVVKEGEFYYWNCGQKLEWHK